LYYTTLSTFFKEIFVKTLFSNNKFLVKKNEKACFFPYFYLFNANLIQSPLLMKGEGLLGRGIYNYVEK